MRSFLILLSFFSSYYCFAQDSARFINRRDKQIAELNEDSNYMRRIHVYDEGTLEYFQKVKFPKITEYSFSFTGNMAKPEPQMDLIKGVEKKSINSDTLITEYYFDNNELIYVYRHISISAAHKDSINASQLFSGKYYFKKKRLLFIIETGTKNDFLEKNRESMQKIFLEEAKEIAKSQPKVYMTGQPI